MNGQLGHRPDDELFRGLHRASFDEIPAPKWPWWSGVAGLLRGRPTADLAILASLCGLGYLGKLFLDGDGDLSWLRFIGAVFTGVLIFGLGPIVVTQIRGKNTQDTQDRSSQPGDGP